MATLTYVNFQRCGANHVVLDAGIHGYAQAGVRELALQHTFVCFDINGVQQGQTKDFHRTGRSQVCTVMPHGVRSRQMRLLVVMVKGIEQHGSDSVKGKARGVWREGIGHLSRVAT